MPVTPLDSMPDPPKAAPVDERAVTVAHPKTVPTVPPPPKSDDKK
jgi:hypothetical protein